eukprot:scaffold174784_cov28-Prasinocladus_malaysianus.AAC.3
MKIGQHAVVRERLAQSVVHGVSGILVLRKNRAHPLDVGPHCVDAEQERGLARVELVGAGLRAEPLGGEAQKVGQGLATDNNGVSDRHDRAQVALPLIEVLKEPLGDVDDAPEAVLPPDGFGVGAVGDLEHVLAASSERPGGGFLVVTHPAPDVTANGHDLLPVPGQHVSQSQRADDLGIVVGAQINGDGVHTQQEHDLCGNVLATAIGVNSRSALRADVFERSAAVRFAMSRKNLVAASEN